MPTHGDGPDQYIKFNNCDQGNPQVTLSVPASVLAALTDEQRARVATIQIDFARRVSRALQRSYEEISVVLGGEPRRPRKTPEPT